MDHLVSCLALEVYVFLNTYLVERMRHDEWVAGMTGRNLSGRFATGRIGRENESD
jgi:hypothetical protein